MSLASLWELAIKASAGRFRLPEDLLEVLVTEGFKLLGVEASDIRRRGPAPAPP